MRDETLRLSLPAAGAPTERPIAIAVVTMGGQGGGVLTEWIVKLAEDQGWVAQSTSVPGVAQRTGATIYYVEMMPPLDGRRPILSLMPTPGDVNIVMASEFMEAGRSILRGIVTPDRTTLIASNHRSLAIAEKMAPGNGIADKSKVTDAIGVTAKKKIIFDMDALAVENGSVISSALFGALAGSGALPFERASYLEVIRAGGKGADASARTFDAAFRRAQAGDAAPLSQPAHSRPKEVVPASAHDHRLWSLLGRLRQELPETDQVMAYAGLRKVVDYQDIAYGEEYLDILKRLHGIDRDCAGGEKDYRFTTASAKYLANAMTYDDVIRVADLNTRRSRRSHLSFDAITAERPGLWIVDADVVVRGYSGRQFF